VNDGTHPSVVAPLIANITTACGHCGEPITPNRRSDTRHCDASCRSAARHARTALSTPALEAGPQAEDRQRHASEPTAPRLEHYIPPREWAWLATCYASRSRSSEDAT
jgi:hypothetical protein